MNYITFILKKKEIWIRRYIVFSCQLCRFYLLLVLVIVLPNYHITLGYRILTTRGLRHLSPWKMPFYWISNEPKHFNYIFYHDNKKKSIYTSYWLPKYRYFFLNLPINIASVLVFTFLTPISTFGTSLNTLLMKMLYQFPPEPLRESEAERMLGGLVSDRWWAERRGRRIPQASVSIKACAWTRPPLKTHQSPELVSSLTHTHKSVNKNIIGSRCS